MPIDRVVPIKQERPDLGGTETDEFDTPADINEDALEARGYYVQNDTSNDTEVLVSRDASNNLTFKDPVVGTTKTLASLLSGGGIDTDNMLFGVDGSFVYTGDFTILTKA